MSAPWVWTPAEGEPDRSWAGGKGCGLARLARLAVAIGYRVPRFVIVRTEAFAPVSEAARMDAPTSASVEIPERLRAEILAALATNDLAGRMLAVRSSAVAEDGAGASFAGQFDTVLGVPGVDDPALWNALRTVWASTQHAHATAATQRRRSSR